MTRSTITRTSVRRANPNPNPLSKKRGLKRKTYKQMTDKELVERERERIEKRRVLYKRKKEKEAIKKVLQEKWEHVVKLEHKEKMKRILSEMQHKEKMRRILSQMKREREEEEYMDRLMQDVVKSMERVNRRLRRPIKAILYSKSQKKYTVFLNENESYDYIF
jgi:hypothetical protein